jgi:acrylyl-CoA reductase (NADPH)
MDRFKALLATKGENGPVAAWTELGADDLMDGDVTVRVTHSTVNYKDALALTGKGPIIRKWPLIPGIDFAGWVEASTHATFKAGDDVILNGWGVGEGHHGGYAQYAQVKGDWLVRRPQAFSRAQTMAIGTAGYTAMLCVLALEAHDVTPAKGPVLVTGAAGGVGSIAVAVLARLGHHVIAATGRPEEEAFLKSLGAAEIINRAELAGPAKALAKERWAGAIDVAGSHTLANVISMTRYGGPRYGSAGLGCALHSARHHAGWRRQRHVPEAEARDGLGAPCPRPRRGDARSADGHAARGGGAADRG